MPERWLLVGNGRGDVSHEDFAQRVEDALREFGPEPEGEAWDDFRGRLRFAGGGFEKSDPGSLLDVLQDARDEPRRGHPGSSTTWPSPVGLREGDRGPGRARPRRGRPRRLREALRHLADVVPRASTTWCTRCSTSSRSSASTTSWARRPARTCTCCGSATACSSGCGTASTCGRCRSTSRRRSTSPTAASSTTRPARCST
nr:hypothetical protein [Angustibacter aerolatus]